MWKNKNLLAFLCLPLFTCMKSHFGLQMRFDRKMFPLRVFHSAFLRLKHTDKACEMSVF